MIGLHVTDPAGWDHLPAEVTHLRLWDVGVHWGAIHTAPGTYDWALLDALVDAAGGRHLTYVIAGCPLWAAKHPDAPHAAPWLGPGSNSLPHDLDAAVEFAWHLATRYAGRIRAYEVWNEPQLADFLHPYTDAVCNALGRMTQRIHRTITAVDPRALVLAGSVLPRASSGGMTRARRYLAQLARRDWPVDGFTTHIYPEPGHGAARWASMLTDVTSTLRALGAPRRRLWVTETTFGLLGPLTTPEQDEAAVRGVYARAGRVPVFWYAANRPDLGGMQITTTPGAESPAWKAIRQHHDKEG